MLPIIGALPDALIIINTGLHSSRSQAQEEVGCRAALVPASNCYADQPLRQYAGSAAAVPTAYAGLLWGWGCWLAPGGTVMLLTILRGGSILLGAQRTPPDRMRPARSLVRTHHTRTPNWLCPQIAVGMGTLAGSTVMLLTIVWGGSILLGRCDLDEQSGLQRDKTRTRKWYDLKLTGVSTDAATPRCAWAMLASACLYLVAQVGAHAWRNEG